MFEPQIQNPFTTDTTFKHANEVDPGFDITYSNTISRDACAKGAQKLIAQFNISPLYACEEEEVLFNGKKVPLISINNPRGIHADRTYQELYGLIIDGNFIKLNSYWLVPSDQIAERYRCYINPDEAKIEKEVVRLNNEYRWKIIFNTTKGGVSGLGSIISCNVQGYTINPSNPSETSFTDIMVTYDLQPSKCKLDEQFCLEYRAEAKNDPTECEGFKHEQKDDVLNERSDCYYAMALRRLDEKLCQETGTKSEKCILKVQEFKKVQNQN
jgi:hypothetical protein